MLNRAITLGFVMQSVYPEVRFCEKSRGKCWFWKLGLSLFVEVSWKMLVLEAWIVTFGESLVENARFGSLHCHFGHKSRGKCSFWKLGVSLLLKVSWQKLVLEAWKGHFWLSSKSVKKECQARASSKRVKKECQARVSSKSVLVRVSKKSVRKDVKQECHARVSSKSV